MWFVIVVIFLHNYELNDKKLSVYNTGSVIEKSKIVMNISEKYRRNFWYSHISLVVIQNQCIHQCNVMTAYKKIKLSRSQTKANEKEPSTKIRFLYIYIIIQSKRQYMTFYPFQLTTNITILKKIRSYDHSNIHIIKITNRN